jgi:hypothetical protein
MSSEIPEEEEREATAYHHTTVGRPRSPRQQQQAVIDVRVAGT